MLNTEPIGSLQLPCHVIIESIRCIEPDITAILYPCCCPLIHCSDSKILMLSVTVTIEPQHVGLKARVNHDCMLTDLICWGWIKQDWPGNNSWLLIGLIMADLTPSLLASDSVITGCKYSSFSDSRLNYNLLFVRFTQQNHPLEKIDDKISCLQNYKIHHGHRWTFHFLIFIFLTFICITHYGVCVSDLFVRNCI